MNIDKDAFSNGQIDSKLWLCEQLENLFSKIDEIWIYGGWYGLTAFLLRSRGNIDIQKIYSYDVNPLCETTADLINENWVIKNWKFKAFTKDCNDIIPIHPDLIINTSTEHFNNLTWWNNIPNGKIVALQGNNMTHNDHCFKFESLNKFIKTFSCNNILYSGELTFNYPNWNFKRYMIIGQK